MASVPLKATYAVDSKHEAFFTGGKVQVSGSGEHIFCQCGTEVQVLEVSTGKVTHTIAQEDDVEVNSFAVSPDDQILVVAYRNLTLKQWNWKEKSVTRTWKAIHTGPVASMTFDPSSTLLATGGADATIKVWDVIKQYCTHNLRGHQGVISVCEFHPDVSQLLLVTAADDYKLRVWQLETSSCLAVLDSHYSMVTALQFSPDGDTLYSGGRDNVVIIWDMTSHTKTKTIPVYESVEGLALLPKAEGGYPSLGVNTQHPHIITGGDKGVLRVWNSSTSQCVYPLTHAAPQEGVQPAQEEGGAPQGAIVTVAFNPRTATVTAVTYDHNILQYSLQDLALCRQFAGYSDDVLDIKFLGEGDTHIAVATNSELIKVFTVETWQCQILRGHRDIVMALDVYRDGTLMLSASKDQSLRVWRLDADTGSLSCVAVASGHTHSVLGAAFSRLQPTFIVSGSQDLTLKVWPLPSEALEVNASVTTLHAKVTEKAHDKDINSVAVSPNDKLIATGSQDKTAKLWSAKNLSLLGVFRGHKRGIWCVQFSSVDQCLATASADTTIKIWALSDYTCVKTFEGHESSVLRVQFITRGMQLISSGSDGLLKLWTIKNNECVKTLEEHDDKVWALAISGSEERVITGAADSNIIVWKDVTEAEQEEARAKQMDFILKEQKLQNLIQQKKFVKAIGLAITLEQPFRLLTIVKEILKGEAGTEDLEKTLCKLRDDQLDAMLRFMVQWNTNSKHCHMAQFVLSLLLKTLTPEQFLTFPNIKASLQGLLPYTERHYHRMNKLQQQTTFVDYTWHSMRLVGGDSLSSVQNTDQNPQGVTEGSFVDREGSSRETTERDVPKVEEDVDASGDDAIDSDSARSDTELEDIGKKEKKVEKADKRKLKSESKGDGSMEAAGKIPKRTQMSPKHTGDSSGTPLSSKKSKKHRKSFGNEQVMDGDESTPSQNAKHKRRKSAVK